MQVIDLSYPFSTEISLYPGTPDPVITKLATHEKDGYAVTQITTTTHTATHLDAPYHMVSNGKKLSELPVSQFVGNALVIPQPKGEFTLDYLKKFEAQIKQAEIIILQTGQEKFWNTDKYLADYPVLTTDAAQWLVSQNIKGIGLDAISIDKPDATEFVLHKIVLGSGIIIIENLTNLEQVKDGIFEFMALPLPLKDGDGAPCRAIGIIRQ